MIRFSIAVALVFFVFCGISVHAAEIADTQPVGYIRADLHCPSAVTFSGTTHLTAHLVNISEAPVLMEIVDLAYLQDFVEIGIPRQESSGGVWGPGTETNLWPNIGRIMVSGMPPRDRLRNFKWPSREGIIVLRDEGYARLITLLPGWLDNKQTPAPVLNNRMHFLLMCVTPNMQVRLPMVTADAVQPGKPIIFDKPNMVYAPGDRLVPFKYSDPKQVPPQPAQPLPVAALADHALELRVELPAEVEAGKDVTAIYLIGNTGSKPIWVIQNRMVPALATWEVVRDEKILATIDGTSLLALLDLLPARAPLLLNPGEYLTYRRVLLASSLPLKRGVHATLRARIEVPWFATEPQAQAEPTLQKLEAGMDFIAK